MKYIWFVIFTLSALTAFGQKSARVRQLEEQRKKALAEVEMTNQLLQETTQTAQNTLNRLNLLSQQILSRKKVISLLNQELGELDNQITASRREINKLEKELRKRETLCENRGFTLSLCFYHMKSVNIDSSQKVHKKLALTS